MKKQNNKNIVDKPVEEQPEFTEKTESVFKSFLKILYWIIGISLILIIAFHMLNIEVLDTISKVLYYIVLSIMIIFLIIEFKSEQIKLKIQQYIEKPS